LSLMGSLLFFLGGKKHSVPQMTVVILKCPVINERIKIVISLVYSRQPERTAGAALAATR
jgi:hypothetical protein